MRDVYSGDKILIDIKEVTANGLEVIENGYIDAHISNLMYRLIHPGEKVIDVGAGFGYYTLYLARIVGSAGQVYSFEGRKNIFELLDSSVRINRFDNVKTFNNILFAENRRLIFNTQNDQKRSNFGVSNIILDNSNNDKQEFVDGVSLDTALADVTNISMLHINANGNELSIILGAQRLIAASPKIKIITSWSKHQMTKYVNVNTIVAQLIDSGFRFWLIKPSNGTLIELSTVEHILQVERGRFLIAKSLQ
jgi:FkbM family methyltransferase